MLGSCYYDVEEELYPQDPDCVTAEMTYEGEISTIINTNCAISGCHVAGTGRVDFTGYAGVSQVANSGELRQKVVIEKSMPPSKPLSACEIAKIEAWLNQGAPEN